MRELSLRLLAVTFMILCAAHPLTSSSADSISSADLPLEARNSDSSSQEEDLISSGYVLPNQIFNNGKPYYVGKDPISGQPDFNDKKPAGIETSANEVFDPKEKIVLSSSSPNIHDFLNLPVKYSSSKFVYPLVSSSYANLKYQGNNKNYMTNKKPTSVAAPVTPASSYHSHNYYTVPTTKLMPVPPTAAGIYTTNKTGTKKPATTTSTSSTTTTTTTTTTSTTTTTPVPSTTPKYTTSTRKPTPIATTTQTPRTTTTRKKFVPTKKYSPSTTTAAPASTPMRFPTEKPSSSSSVPRPTPTQTTVYPSKPSTTMTTSSGQRYPSTNQPIVFTESPSSPPVPTPNTTPRIPNLEAADVYQTLGQKHTEQHFEQKPSMTLADIFNSLAEEESAVSSLNQGSQSFDAEGNLMQPIEPSRPSPFIRPQNSVRPTHNTTPYGQPTPPPQRYQPQQQQHQQPQPQQQQPQQQALPQNDQKLISGSQKNYSNEYVSYQVQQPNVLQYRPVPGAINNVVISPGQNSATFVLGSQQQVGVNAFGSIEKEPLFSKEPPVQYGTVINEDISSLTRPVGIATQNNFPTQQAAAAPPPPTFQQMPDTQITSNFHQNGNFAHASAEAESPSNASNKYHETPPAAPTPYQQLPLIGTTKRPQKQQQKLPQQRPQSNPHSGYQQQNPNQLNQNEPTKPSLGRPQSSSQQPSTQPASINISNEQETQELLVSTNIRFPANDEQVNEFGHSPLMSGPPEGPQVNGHAQPLSLQQLQQSNTVVFPKTNEDALNQQPPNAGNMQPNELLYNPGEVQIQQHEVLTMNQHKQKLNFPQNAGNTEQSSTLQHIPSQHMEPPPRFDPQEASQKRPQTNRPQAGPHPSAYMFNEFTRKPLPGITRPNSERHLPNILPQFRPNAKISSGHPPTYNQEPGNIRIPSHQSPKRPNSSPQFAHRHQPMPQAQQLQQQRFSMKRIADYPLTDANRRIYRQPPYGGQHPQFADRMYARRPMPNGMAQPSADSYAFERHAVSSNSEPYKTLPQAMALEKLAAFEEEDLVINDPPLPMTPSKDTKMLEEDKLEPVVTLQMLQSHKKTTLPAYNLDGASGEIQVPSSSTHFAGVPSYQNQNQASQDGLYVVYPMRPDADPQDLNVAAESKDPMPAIAHIESAPTTGSGEYQNTPFSVLRDQPQEPILMVKNKKAQSLQQQTKYKTENQLPADKFPYPIEKPDPSYSDMNMRNRMSGLLLAPRIINAAYQPTGTVAPIALAYTPTEPNIYKNHASYPQVMSNNHASKYSNINLSSSVISEIRHTDSQTEESLNNDFDFRGQNYEKDFMAPFYPSVSLGSATNAPSNGWNILPSSTVNSVFEKNNINRADVGNAKDDDADSLETTTKTFELDSFQPELQGGFKPIYPPGYKMEEEPEEVHLHEGINMPVALASRMELPVSLPARPTSTIASTTTTSTTTATPQTQPLLSSSSSTTTSTTQASLSEISNTTIAPSTTTSAPTSPKPTLRKKSAFETSLAALLFGEEEDDFEQSEDIEARKDDTIRAVSGPRSNMPRSGPRNLKLS